MMEVKAASVLWGRSVERHKLRYTTLLSDGDAKTFKELTELKPYGDTELVKEDCINHVSKRLATALRNVVTDCKKRGVTLGGRGCGMLTQNTIRKLTIYFSRAIRGQTSVEEMRRAILASLHHGYSTDENPSHEYCPPGLQSWCFFQQALAKHNIPGPHEKFVHTPLNRAKLENHLNQIYNRLTEEHLLTRCLSGKTQNANEALHSLIWSRCSKDNFASRRRVLFAVLTAIQEFINGSIEAQDTATFFGFSSGSHMKRLGSIRQRKRERNSRKYQRDRASKRRDFVRKAQQKRQEELMQLEGGPAYAAGKF